MKKLLKNVLAGILLNILIATGVYAGPSEYTTFVTFPAGYQIGDFIEFVRVTPVSAGASGNFEVSIAYTRGNIAAAATYLTSVAHSSPNLWREAGRINSNGYGALGSDGHNFTIDVNAEYGNAKLRIRAIRTLGVLAEALGVYVKVRSINEISSWTGLSTAGSDLTVTKFLPMTNDWSLYVGNTTNLNGALIAIKAIENGNVGIGTATPTEKLSVKGKVRAQEVKVEMSNWADFVFAKDYVLPTLQETEKHIKEKGHLPGIPSAAEVGRNGIELGDMNKKLLQKIEELTLCLIEKDKKMKTMEERLDKIERHQNINILK